MGGQEVMVSWEMEQPLAVLRAELSKELLGGAPLGFALKALCSGAAQLCRWNHNHNKPFEKARGSGRVGGGGFL